MIFDASTLPLGSVIKADLCVVGAGAGGAMVAMTAAEAGMKVVVLEAGAFITPGEMNQREEEMVPRLFWESGAQKTHDRGVWIHQGKGVGGSTLHNLNLCKRIPNAILESWHTRRGLSALSPAVWHALYTEVEQLIGVEEIPASKRNRANLIVKKGCDALGWKSGPLKHNRAGCIGAGFCEIGCSFDAKNNALKVMVPRAVKAGATVLAHCQATHVLHGAGATKGVDAVILDPVSRKVVGALRVEAPKVCLSASATRTPAILLRSRVPDPGGETGNGLRVHPGIAVAGDFDEPVDAWVGVPQSYECTEWLDFEEDRDGHRLWIIPVFGHPMGVSTMLPGHGETHHNMMRRYAYSTGVAAMLHDHTAGTVRPKGDLGIQIDYWPDERDRAELSLGFELCAKLLLAAGARSVTSSTQPTHRLNRGGHAGAFRNIPIQRGETGLSAVHPMASVPMGDDPRVAAVDSTGRHHHLEGLWLADGSLFPSSIGVPPQLSIYSLALHVARALVNSS